MKELILFKALENFHDHTGWKAEWRETEKQETNGTVHFRKGRRQFRLPAEIRSVLTTSLIPGLLKIKEECGALLLIAGNISDKIANELRELGLYYLDSAGNTFIDQDKVFILIEGKKTEKDYTSKPLFTKTSIKLIFHLLTMEGLAEKTYREISEVAGVSLDTISRTMNVLKENRFLIEVTANQLELVRKEALLKRWIPEYGDRLKPKLLMGRFRFLKENSWKDLEFDPSKTQWGGEPGADKLLNILHPEKFTIYTMEEKTDLVNNYRLIPDADGNIEVYRAFWNMEYFPASQAVLPLLIYADLLLSGIARNAEVAKKLMDVEKEAVLPTV